MGEAVSNMEIGKDTILLSINPKIYPIEAIYSAAYVFLDKSYILLDGDPETEVIVEIKPKKEGFARRDLEMLGREFNNELLNYGDYLKRAERTKAIREIILQRALLTNVTNAPAGEAEDKFLSKLDSEDGLAYLDDPEGIAVPWEEKYGKNARKSKS